MADETYAIRVYARRSDGRIFAFSWDGIPSLFDLMEEIEQARRLIGGEGDWCFDGEGWGEEEQPECVRELFRDPEGVSTDAH